MKPAGSEKRKSRQFSHLKKLLIALRKQGKTYSEIREAYPVSKGTISFWLKDVKIPEANKRRMERRSYRKWKMANETFIKERIEKASKIRQGFEDKAKSEIKHLTPYSLKLIGVALYWAEGGKTKRGFLRFVNPDPMIIKLMMRFFREICGMPNEKIKGRIHIYPQMNYEQILTFWSELTQLPAKNFYRPQTQTSKSSKGRRSKKNLPYGTLHLSVFNTPTVSKVMGWIKGISEQM